MRHKTLGITLIVVILAATVSVIYYTEISEIVVPPQPIHNATTEKTYTNAQYGFSVKYDQKYNLDTAGQQQNFFRSPGIDVADIIIPQTLYPKTNMGPAQVGFAVRTNTAASDCAYYLSGADVLTQMTDHKTLNGQTASYSEFTGGAAGTIYTTHLYHIAHNNTCYEINLTFGIAEIGNFPAGAVTPVDENSVWNRLDTIAQSFKFIN